LWHSDYLNWKLLVERFWDILRGYSESVEWPFALADVDEDGGDYAVPDGGVFADPDVRRRYRTLLRVNDSHAQLRQHAFPFMADMGRPPLPNPA
jgi:hypothetical protein